MAYCQTGCPCRRYRWPSATFDLTSAYCVQHFYWTMVKTALTNTTYYSLKKTKIIHHRIVVLHSFFFVQPSLFPDITSVQAQFSQIRTFLVVVGARLSHASCPVTQPTVCVRTQMEVKAKLNVSAYCIHVFVDVKTIKTLDIKVRNTQ